jgi:UMP-CMP kinase
MHFKNLAVRSSRALICFASAAGFSAPVFAEGSSYNYAPSRHESTKVEATTEDSSAKKPLFTPKPSSSTLKPRVIFVLGGPGAGKGTQCAKLVKEYDFVHLSAGDLLREDRAAGGEVAEMIQSYINEGKIVPVKVTVQLIKKAMEKSGATKFLVDGFPRNYENLNGWTEVMGDSAIVDGVLQYDVAEETLTSRLLKRGETSGRSDDNIESIIKRLRTYNESTVAVIDHFEKLGQVTRIKGSDPIDVVFKNTQVAVTPTIKADVLAHNQRLLDAIGELDYSTWDSLVDDNVTCFEPEGEGLIKGKAFHQSVFENAKKARFLAGGKSHKTTIEDAQVTILDGKTALAVYKRVGGAVPVFETRVWKLSEGGKGWKVLHLHRSTS